MGQFFPPERGDMEITEFYADNQPYCREVRFSVPYDEWSEFEGSTFFQELSRYLEDLKKRTQDSNKARHEPERTEETEMFEPVGVEMSRLEAFLYQSCMKLHARRRKRLLRDWRKNFPNKPKIE